MQFVKIAQKARNISSLGTKIRFLGLSLTILALSCSGKGNVDLSKATKLTAEPVPTPKDTPVIPNPLFNNAPGTTVSLKSMGTIDQTGTSITSDYDGDGILNQDGSNPANNREVQGGSNQWVADYPVVEASVAPPVTMKIQILREDNTQKEEIISQINSDDYEEVKEKGTEKIHQNELNARTAQFQDSYASETASQGSTSSSSESEASGSISILGVSLGGGGSSSQSNSSSWGNKTSYSATKTQFPTVPFKNNLDRDAISVKNDAAARNARKYRLDKKDKKIGNDKIEPNAGNIRAALYIKNLSVNMPVKLTNILCTLMFEANNGQLIPVQSFRLRNEDYSLFSVSVYGGSEFGPYVVDLPNLNTAEIERALQLGFNPKIFIVDYEMTHVSNSSYRNVLAGYNGDNLKIVEENTKGRTALVKIKGPQMREMYRVAAFTVSNESSTDTCEDNNGLAACPGITMRKALERIRDAATVRGEQYYATNVEYSDYIFDFGDQFPRMPADQKMAYVRTVKTIGNIANNIPCEGISQLNGAPQDLKAEPKMATVPVCKVKPFSQFSASEKESFGVWVVFSNGKFYTQSQYETGVGSAPKTYAFNTTELGSKCYSTTCTAPVAQGIDGTIWVGDNYDWVYLTLEQFLFLKRQFGNNPLETGETLSFNTKWDLGDGNNNIFDPQFHSKYLGQAVLGDRLEIVIDLKDTKYLNPKFNPDATNGNLFMSNFTYDLKTVDKKFNFEEVIDFEINLGTGGTNADWGNIIQPAGSKNAYYADGNAGGIVSCGKNLDYNTQQFKICVELPGSYTGANSDGRVNVYLRPILHNAYRNSVWPKNYAEVNKFQGELASTYDYQVTAVDLVNVSGNKDDVVLNSEKLRIVEAGYSCEYTITGITLTANGGAHVDLASSPYCPGAISTTKHSGGLIVGVSANLENPEVYFSVSQNPASGTNYFNDFNTGLVAGSPQKLLTSNALFASDNCANDSNPLRYGPTCFGFPQSVDNTQNFITTNWIGGVDVTRSFNDASHLVRGDYLTNLAATFFPSLGNSSRWRLWPVGTILQSLTPVTNTTLADTLGVARKEQVFQYQDRTLIIWEETLVTGRSIWLRIINNKSGETIIDLTKIAQDVLPNEADSPESLPFSAVELNGKVTVAYGITWREQVMNPDTQHIPQSYYDGQFIHKSSLVSFDLNFATQNINLSQITQLPVLSYLPVWLRSYSIGLGGLGAKKYLTYSTARYSWDATTYEVKVPAHPGYYCLHLEANSFGFHFGCQSPYGCQCFEGCFVVASPTDGTYDGNGNCIYPAFPTAAGVAVGNTVQSYTIPDEWGLVTRYPSDGADKCTMATIGQNGLIASTSTACDPSQVLVDNLSISADESSAFVGLKAINTGLVAYLRNFDLTQLTEIEQANPVYEDHSFPGFAFMPDNNRPEKFGQDSIVQIGYAPNSTGKLVRLKVARYGQTPDFYPLAFDQSSPNSKPCTAAKCVSLRKYAPYAADILWLEDEIDNTRSLYQAQVTITDATYVSITAARLIVRAPGINAPESLIVNERVDVTSWLQGGVAYSQAIDKWTPNLIGGIQTVSPSGANVIGRSAIDVSGSFYITQSTATPGVFAANFLRINEAVALTPKFGLNNYFTAPLIERHFNATARVLPVR